MLHSGRSAPAPPRGAPARRPLRLADEYPDELCELDHSNPYELLAATILSAQSPMHGSTW